MSGHATLPIAPLWRLAEVRADMTTGSATAEGTFTQVVFADLLGMSERSVARWLDTGRIPWVSADEAAVSLGFHPSLVWGDAWWNVKGDFDAIAAGMTDDLTDELVGALSDEAMDDF
jgi:hypothetical protein